MAVTPEQFIQELARRGIQIDLESAEPVPTFRLTAEAGKIPERLWTSITKYIRSNREGIYALFGQFRCYECWCLLEENPAGEDITWHAADEVYCIECWRAIVADTLDVDQVADPSSEIAPAEDEETVPVIVDQAAAFAQVHNVFDGEIRGAPVFPVPYELVGYRAGTAPSLAECIAQERRQRGETDQLQAEELEQEAARIAEAEKLPLSQARYWARTRAELVRTGYHDKPGEPGSGLYERDQVKIRDRVAFLHAHPERWFNHG